MKQEGSEVVTVHSLQPRTTSYSNHQAGITQKTNPIWSRTIFGFHVTCPLSTTPPSSITCFQQHHNLFPTTPMALPNHDTFGEGLGLRSRHHYHQYFGPDWTPFFLSPFVSGFGVVIDDVLFLVLVLLSTSLPFVLPMILPVGMTFPSTRLFVRDLCVQALAVL